ncbi:hypothetical protein L2E82_51671 [Cichorium intybus]|nr:hypothetical protein L2E82_51671 [Cichorium intybus]
MYTWQTRIDYEGIFFDHVMRPPGIGSVHRQLAVATAVLFVYCFFCGLDDCITSWLANKDLIDPAATYVRDAGTQNRVHEFPGLLESILNVSDLRDLFIPFIPEHVIPQYAELIPPELQHLNP